MKSSRGCLPNWICLQLAMCSNSLVLCATIGKVWRRCKYNRIVWVVHYELIILCCLCRPHTDTKLHSGCGCSRVHCGPVTAHTRRPGHKISYLFASHISPQTGVCICVRWVANRGRRHVHFFDSLIWFNYHIDPYCLKCSTYYWSSLVASYVICMELIAYIFWFVWVLHNCIIRFWLNRFPSFSMVKEVNHHSMNTLLSQCNLL